MAKKSAPNIHQPSQQPTSDPIAAERKRLLKRIRKVDRRIPQLKVRYYSLIPISRLPPELLIRIFFFVQSNFRDVYGVDYYKWTVITQVSQSWRTLALETKLLWNVISHNTKTIEPRWITPSLDRSRSLHIHVVVKFDWAGEQLGLLERIAGENHRIRSLYVDVGTRGSMRGNLKALSGFLAMEVPVLEWFVLRGVDRNQGERAILDPLTTPLFNSVAPRLKCLRVLNANLGLHSLPFNRITILRLYYPQGHRGELSLRTLFAFLRVTRLEVLCLRNVLSDQPNDNDIDSLEPISFTSLSSLYLSAHTHHCTTFLSHVVIPPSCLTKLRTWAHAPFTTIPPTLLGTLTARLSDDLTQFIGLDLCIEKSYAYTSFGLRKEGDYEDGKWQYDPLVDIRLMGAQNFYSSFPSLALFSNVWSVILTGSNFELSVVTALLELPSLELIQIEAGFVTVFSNYLYDNPNSFAKLRALEVTSTQRHPPLLEDLERVLIRLQDLGRDEITVTLYGTEDGWDDSEPFPDLLDRLGMVCILRVGIIR
ncbi:hypothetical protein BDN72DRAFT_964436 [Pluteus cervinus]|uniref:Uncharacterized protein n=1 Tax=Pluteus cervinus TaxID=181527 RepID=A0ACD3A9R8_9AGAR|nr:hypothetical protein BDN72DRAFT_964436 [Pluteus cervinus]